MSDMSLRRRVCDCGRRIHGDEDFCSLACEEEAQRADEDAMYVAVEEQGGVYDAR